VATAAEVQNLCVLLSNGQMDQTLFNGFYASTMTRREIARFHTTATPITLTANQTTVNLPDDLLNLLTLIYDDTVLSDLELRELESLNPGWRNTVGSPIAFTRQAETVKSVEVWPAPFETSPPIIPVHGLPTGEDYAPGNGIAIYEEQRADLLDYLVLPVALLVLWREYVRESPHTDVACAMLCFQLAGMLLEMLS